MKNKDRSTITFAKCPHSSHTLLPFPKQNLGFVWVPMVYFGHVQEKLDSSPVRGQNWYSLSQSWGPILLVKYQFRQEHMTQL